MSDFIKMYETYKKKEQLNEFESNWKKSFIPAKHSTVRYHWEFKLLPATIDIDFDYKVTFNKKNIEKDFELEGDTIDYEALHYDVIKPAFSDRYMKVLAKKIPVPGFDVQFVTYGGEYDIKTLDPSRKDKYHFTHIVTIEAKDKKKTYTKKEIDKLVTDFVKKFEPLAFTSTKYYTISKK